METGMASAFVAVCVRFFRSGCSFHLPLYALRERMSAEQIAFILPCFSLGGIIFQLPLGALSDRFGRREIITGALLAGAGCFLIALTVGASMVGLAACLFTAGMFTGSLFSLASPI
ncbi:Transporter, MFS superfamily protein [Geobacillus sp. WSUCF1]|nr:Transporter, MFS superfamily protein [Geobacillus sp. WSUCF1]